METMVEDNHHLKEQIKTGNKLANSLYEEITILKMQLGVAANNAEHFAKECGDNVYMRDKFLSIATMCKGRK